MKILAFIFVVYSPLCVGQLDLPELSPEGRTTQKVGHMTIELRYGRPAARERKVFGGLVPYQRLWRTGAGKCSTISFSHGVVIKGKTIDKGTYAIVAIPGRNVWTILLNSDTTKLYGDPSEYDIGTEVIRFESLPQVSPRFYESLTMGFDIVQSDIIFSLAWENAQVSFPIHTGIHKGALENISAALKQEPSNAELLTEASYYYLMTNEDADQVLKWLDQALTIKPDRWSHQLKVEALEKLRRYQEAREAATNAIAFLQKTKPIEYDFEIRMYQERMKAWEQ